LRPVLDLNDAEAVADYLVNNQERFAYSFEDRFD
jgi:molybdopterin-guanine dinucleotide biosynthesis protein B